MSSKKYRIRAALAVLALAAALLVSLRWRLPPQDSGGEKHITITVTDQDGGKRRYAVDTHAAYLKEAAQSVLSLDGEETQYGYVVGTINGITADFHKENAYWAVYVNGDLGNYSVDRQPLRSGDAYAFVYESL